MRRHISFFVTLSVLIWLPTYYNNTLTLHSKSTLLVKFSSLQKDKAIALFIFKRLQTITTENKHFLTESNVAPVLGLQYRIIISDHFKDIHTKNSISFQLFN